MSSAQALVEGQLELQGGMKANATLDQLLHPADKQAAANEHLILAQNLNAGDLVAATKASLAEAQKIAKLFNLNVDLPISKNDMQRWDAVIGSGAPSTTDDGAPLQPVTVSLDQGLSNATGGSLAHLSIIPRLDASKLATVSLKDRQRHKNQWKAHRQSLPIFKAKDDSVIPAFRNHAVTIIRGNAGVGKTLQLPQLLLETDLCKKKRVILVVPTNIAAMSVGARLQVECGPLETVGVVTSLTNTATAASHVVVCTPEVLCRTLVVEKALADVGAIIVDEAHDQILNVDPFLELLLTSLREMLVAAQQQVGSSFPKLLLTVTGDQVAENGLLEYFKAAGTKAISSSIKTVVIGGGTTSGGDSGEETAAVTSALDLEQVVNWVVSGSSAFPTEEESVKCLESNTKEGTKAIEASSLAQELEGTLFGATGFATSVWSSFLRRAAASVVKSATSPMLVVLLPTASHCDILASQLQEDSTTKTTTVVALHEDLELKCSPEEIADKVNTIFSSATEEDKKGGVIVVATAGVASTVLSHSQVSLIIDANRLPTLFPGSGASYLNSVKPTSEDEGDAQPSKKTTGAAASLRKGFDPLFDFTSPDHQRAVRRLCASTSTKATSVLQLASRSQLQQSKAMYGSTIPNHPLVRTEDAEGLTLLIRSLFSKTVVGSVTASKNAAWLSTKVRPFLFSAAVGGGTNFMPLNKEATSKFLSAGEDRLVKMACLDAEKTVTIFGGAVAAQPFPIPVSRGIILSALFEKSSVQQATIVFASWLVGLPVGTADILSAAKAYFTSVPLKETGINSFSDAEAILGIVSMFCSSSKTAEEKAEFLEVLGLENDSFLIALNRVSGSLAKTCDRLREGDALVLQSDPREGALLPGAQALLSVSMYPNVGCSTAHGGGGGGLLLLPRPGKPVLRSPYYAGGNPSGLNSVENCSIVGHSSAGSVFSHQKPETKTLVAFSESTEVPSIAKSSHLSSAGSASTNHASLVKDANTALSGPLVVFCGAGSSDPQPAPPRKTRGWLPAVTTAWRNTRAASSLPPRPQKEAKPIPAHTTYSVQDSEQRSMNIDQTVSFNLSSTASEFLQKLRDRSRQMLNTMLAASGPTGSSSPAEAGQRTNLKDVQDALEWLALRERDPQEYHRARREDPSRKPDAPVVVLKPEYAFSYHTGKPVSSDSPVAGGIAASTKADASAASGATTATAAATYSGPIPDKVTMAWVQRSIKAVKDAGTRAHEQKLLQSARDKTNKQMISFLDPEMEFYGYWSHMLRQAAPDLTWLGDDLPQLETYLKELEVEVQAEVNEARAKEAQRRAAEQAKQADRQKNIAAGNSIFGVALPDPNQKLHEAVHGFQQNADEEILQEFMDVAQPLDGDQAKPTTYATTTTAGGPLIPPTLEGGGLPGMAPPALPGMDFAPPQQHQPEQQQFQAPAPPPPQQEIQLYDPAVFARPPPMLPEIALAQHRSPSVLVYPLPPREKLAGTDPLPKTLARALGEKLETKVGPTSIIGEWARIDVPNHSIEQRALSMSWFFCLGCKLQILVNNRIINNPDVDGLGRLFLTRQAQIADELKHHKDSRNVRYSPGRGLEKMLAPPETVAPAGGGGMFGGGGAGGQGDAGDVGGDDISNISD